MKKKKYYKPDLSTLKDHKYISYPLEGNNIIDYKKYRENPYKKELSGLINIKLKKKLPVVFKRKQIEKLIKIFNEKIFPLQNTCLNNIVNKYIRIDFFFKKKIYVVVIENPSKLERPIFFDNLYTIYKTIFFFYDKMIRNKIFNFDLEFENILSKDNWSPVISLYLNNFIDNILYDDSKIILKEKEKKKIEFQFKENQKKKIKKIIWAVFREHLKEQDIKTLFLTKNREIFNNFSNIIFENNKIFFVNIMKHEFMKLIKDNKNLIGKCLKNEIFNSYY